MSRVDIPEIEVKEHPNYRTINVNAVFGGLKGMYFEAVVISEELKAAKALSTATASEKPTLNRTLECRLIIDPFQAKSIAQWLTRHVSEYEKQFGRIPSSEELQDKSGNSGLDNSKDTKTVYQ